jgi:hypothetical protein
VEEIGYASVEALIWAGAALCGIGAFILILILTER